jgi:hypothetical protein
MSKRVRPKVRGKKDVLDEWEVADIDRDQQKEGLKRRERRWKEIEREIKRQKMLEKKAIVNAGKMETVYGRQPTPLEEAWLRCDYVLFNIMTMAAYQMLEWIRVNDPKGYRYLYRTFMSKNMMDNIEYFVDFFAQGNTIPKKIPKHEVIRHYVKYKGYKGSVKVKHKGEEEYDL